MLLRNTRNHDTIILKMNDEFWLPPTGSQKSDERPEVGCAPGHFPGKLIDGKRTAVSRLSSFLKGFGEINRLKNIYILAGLVLILCLSGCGKRSAASNFIFESKEDFAGRDIATITGTVVDGHVDEILDGIKWHYYDDQTVGLEAMKKEHVRCLK